MTSEEVEAVTGPWAKRARPKPTALFGPRQPTALDVLGYSVRATGFSLWASFSLLGLGCGAGGGDYARRVSANIVYCREVLPCLGFSLPFSLSYVA